MSSAFVLIGIPNPNELAVNGGAINNNLGPGGAATFGYGGQKISSGFFVGIFLTWYTRLMRLLLIILGLREWRRYMTPSGLLNDFFGS